MEVGSSSSTDLEEELSAVDEIGELLEEMRKEHRRANGRERKRRWMRNAGGLGCNKYQALRKRQVKIETQAWKQAAREYLELLNDMCEQKLAPNLPYVKSLFLGWFQPLKDKIAAEQELIRQNKSRAGYAPYFTQLPADMMSVITMHKMMTMLMSGGEHGCIKVVHAACAIGEAIEHEVKIYRFLEKTKTEKDDQCSQSEEEGAEAGILDQARLQKRVNDLIKKQKLHAVSKIVKAQDDSEPWGTAARAKVGSRLIEFLTQTAFIQLPYDQAGGDQPDIRPAFIHTFHTVVLGRGSLNKRYGVIECDPQVLKGLEKTVGIQISFRGKAHGDPLYADAGATSPMDRLGAVAVNLVMGEKPADVYSGIAARVLAIMQRDAKKDPAIFPEAAHAQKLIPQVDRKLVKQTVMTSVYGVTYIGARDQIKRRLKERNAFADDQELFGTACYAAKTTLTALGEMFEAARGIMRWLGDCAKIIACENESVRWTTPLGLPVVQPYHKLSRHIVKTSLQVLSLQKETDEVMIKRQRTAFPPNFVHSLDGSHMMMTAIACKRGGLNVAGFSGVHDSYWTHACDVESMNRILREKFVELYEQPILENLLESFQQSFPTLCFPPLPERGDFDLKDVLKSLYFFN